MTDTEQTLWYYLRGKRFLGYKFKRQVPIGNYIVDFLCTDNKTIIELDGAGHLEPIQIQHDNEREIYLKEKGYKVIRILNNELENMESVLEYIRINIENPSPQPSPLERGEPKYKRIIMLTKIINSMISFAWRK